MLDKDQIAAASQTLHDHWRAGTKLDALDARCGRTTALTVTRSRPSSKTLGGKSVRLEDRGHQRGRTEAHQCRRAAGRSHPAETVIADGGTASMAGNEMRVGEPEFAFRMATRSAAAAIALHVSTRCSTPSTRCIPRSKFRIRASPISSAPAKRSSSPTMPARICSCWVPPTTANWRALDLVEERPVITLRGEQLSSVTARTCSAIPAWRWPGSPTNCASSA